MIKKKEIKPEKTEKKERKKDKRTTEDILKEHRGEEIEFSL